VALIPQFWPIKITQNNRVLSVDCVSPKTKKCRHHLEVYIMFKDAEETSLLGSIASFSFENSESDEASLCPSMSLPQRLFGCALCLVVGWILSFGAFQRIILLIQGMSFSLFFFFLCYNFYYSFLCAGVCLRACFFLQQYIIVLAWKKQKISHRKSSTFCGLLQFRSHFELIVKFIYNWASEAAHSNVRWEA